MKRIVCSILFILLLTNGLAIAEPETQVMQLHLVNKSDYSADDWMSDEFSRATITVLLAAELSIATEGEISLHLDSPTYISKLKDIPCLTILAHHEGELVCIIYMEEL